MAAREKKVPAHEASPTGLLTGWARQGVQSFVAAQKILMDLAAQENALLVGMLREGLSSPATRIGDSMTGIAEKGVENLAAAGKLLLDLAADETALAVDGIKEGLRLPAPAEAVAEMARHRVDTLIQLHKRLLDATAEQAHAAAECYRDKKTMNAPARVAELARRGIQEFVESEKKFLDLAAQEVTAATKENKRPHKVPRHQVEILAEVAREGAEKYFDTQKKLLNLAVEQVEETAKIARNQRTDNGRKEMRPFLGELTEKSMKNLVAAEKSLLDLAMKPAHRAAAESGRRTARRHHNVRTERKHEAAAPKAAAPKAAALA
jgi:hypothetical protein